MNALKSVRFLRDISQASLAKKVDLDPAIISRLENDLCRDTPAVIRWKERICKTLKMPLEMIFPGTKKPENDR